MNKKRLIAILMTGLCLLSHADALAQYIDTEEPFFSYKRFYAQLDILNDVYGDKKGRSDIKAFARNYADGIYAVSAGDLEKARAKLLRARVIWPEYFAVDFLLARVSEDAGDYGLSARFYKSYLNKLKAFSEGTYRISAPLMAAITPYRIENYNDAYELVNRRLEGRGIDMAAIQPFHTMPRTLKIFFMLVLLGIGFMIAIYGIIPRVRRWRRIANPPEGYWTCRKCGTYNLDIRIECEKCGGKKKR